MPLKWLRQFGLFGKPETWFDQSLVACVYPKTDASLSALEAQGVSLIINLHPRAHPPERLARHKIIELHLPTRDFTPPSLADLRRGLIAVEDALAKGRRVAVHCGAGLGRTGTFVACYFVRRGMSADEAIRRVRELRPGSVETSGQVDAVRRFAASDQNDRTA